MPFTTSSSSVDKLRRLSLDYTPPDKLKMRSTRHVIYELAPSSEYSVAIRTRNNFGFSDWAQDFDFKTAPGTAI